MKKAILVILMVAVLFIVPLAKADFPTYIFDYPGDGLNFFYRGTSTSLCQLRRVELISESYISGKWMATLHLYRWDYNNDHFVFVWGIGMNEGQVLTENEVWPRVHYKSHNPLIVEVSSSEYWKTDDPTIACRQYIAILRKNVIVEQNPYP